MIGFINRIKLIARRMPFIDWCFDFLNSVLVLQETGGTFTSDGNENTVYIENSPLGVFKARYFVCDFDNEVGGDTIIIRVYYRVNAGAGLQLGQSVSYVGADGGLPSSRKLDPIGLWDVRFGMKITEERTGGVDHDYDWSLTQEA